MFVPPARIFPFRIPGRGTLYPMAWLFKVPTQLGCPDGRPQLSTGPKNGENSASSDTGAFEDPEDDVGKIEAA